MAGVAIDTMTNPRCLPGLALRISVTDRCPLRCLYCRPQPVLDRVPGREALKTGDIVRFVRVAQQTLGVAKVRLTGGEPLIRPDLVSIVAALGELGLPDLALTTNGQRLAELARPLRDRGLGRVNVSLDSLDDGTFTRLAQGGKLARTLAGIDAACAVGLSPVRINTVVLRGINDHEAEALMDFALMRDCELRFIELMPSGLAKSDYERWFLSSAELRERLARTFAWVPEAHVAGSSGRRYHVTRHGRRGTVGFISPSSHPFCSGCRRLRLTSDGRLLGCLARRDQVDIMELLRSEDLASDEGIASAMSVALGRKREAGSFTVAMPMSSVGG
jgi:GTP 3',8-cyclase